MRPLHPPFGQADLSNCERELIHLAGSVQPHGVLLVLSERDLRIEQVSSNTLELLGVAPEALLGASVDRIGAGLGQIIRDRLDGPAVEAPSPLRVILEGPRAATAIVHRANGGGIVLELEEITNGRPRRLTPGLAPHLTEIITRFGAAHSIQSLADLVVEELQTLIGYDRVMVYRFDDQGHGEVIAEAKRREMESYLNRHYPATDIPQRARELYLRNKVRLLVDVQYTPVPIIPRLRPDTNEELDLSMSVLRSISPIHVQYLRNMGVGATLVASLVHEGKLWGLIACHHRRPRYIPFDLRAACELLAEVVSTRISALEHYAEAQAEVLVRRLEQRLLEETSSDGDWRRALFDAPRQLLQPVGASGAALLFEGEVHTTGDVPATTDLRELFRFVSAQGPGPVYQTASISRAHPALAHVTSAAAGVLVVRLAPERDEYLAWFRHEQLRDVTWGGDPSKAVVFSESMELSPRRSFAAWHELVRETSLAWSSRDVAIARAIGTSLADLILQMRAVRVLIAESQLASMRDAVLAAAEPVVIADGSGRVLLVNEALSRLLAGPHRTLERLDDLARSFEESAKVAALLQQVRENRRPYRGELTLTRSGMDARVPVALRADPIPAVDGSLFGIVVMMTDLTSRKEAETARSRLQRAIFAAQRPMPVPGSDAARPLSPAVQGLIAAIWSNAGVAASELADSADTASIAPLLAEVESATRHAAQLSAMLGRYTEGDDTGT